MKLFFKQNESIMNPERLLRHAGYAYIRDRKTGQDSMARRLGGDFYPRFHLYIENRGEQVILNLHLDQKQPRYEGTTAHNADYDGDVVGREAERIRKIIISNSQSAIINVNNTSEIIDDVDLLDKIRPKQFSMISEKVEKKSWWMFWK